MGYLMFIYTNEYKIYENLSHNFLTVMPPFCFSRTCLLIPHYPSLSTFSFNIPHTHSLSLNPHDIPHLSNHLKVIKTVFWSDSQIVIHWLSSQKELKCFVQNRVKEIHQLTNNATWNYCPTTDNPADLLTRGISADNLSKSTLWTTGPPWITNPDNWPAWNPSNAFLQSSLDEDQDASEVNPTDPNTPESPTPTHTSIAQIITPTRFSNLQ